jgi:hypothetical protein
MDILFPRIPLTRLPAMLSIAMVGAILAGIYGALHDQISYTISPEYFTKLKFRQFWYADFSLGDRIFAGVVGFLASWWVGLIAAWLLARIGLSELPTARRRVLTLKAFAIVAAVAITSGIVAVLVGVARTQSGDLRDWQPWDRALELRDLRGFVIVAHLHNGSYLGALLGFLLAAVYTRLSIRSSSEPDKTPV